MRTFFIITIFFLLTACAAPTAAVTIPAVTTLTATPSFTATPPLSPEQVKQMKAIDEIIKGWGVDPSEWNYSYNTETGKLGIYLAKNAFLSMGGEIQLTLADGSVVDLNSSDVTFDQQNELKIAGYTFDEKTGEWVSVPEMPAAINGLPGIEVSQDGMYIATLANGTKLSGSAESIYVGSDGIPRMGGAKYNKETKTWELNIVTMLYGENAPKYNQEDIDNGNVDEFFKAIYEAEGWAKVMVGRELPSDLTTMWAKEFKNNIDADLDGETDDTIQTFYIDGTSRKKETVPWVPGGIFVEVTRSNGMKGRVMPVFATRGDNVLIFKEWFGILATKDGYPFAEQLININLARWRNVMRGGQFTELDMFFPITPAYSIKTNAIRTGSDALSMFKVGSPETESRMTLMENINLIQSEELEGDIFFSTGLGQLE